MPVLARAPRLPVHAVVRVQEHDEPRIRERGPHRLERVVVQAVSEAAGAHDHAAEVRKPRNLLDCAHERVGGCVWHEREKSEAVQPL